MHTNTAVKVYYQVETNYAGGDNGGAEYAMTHPNADDFVRFNYLAGPVKMKAINYKRKLVKGPGIGLGKGILLTTGKEFPDLELSYYLQTAADPFKATAVGGTQGSYGTSYIIQVVIPDPDESGTTLVYNIFGAQIASYNVKAAVGDDSAPIVTVKFTCYDMAINTGTAQTGAYPAGVINEWDDLTLTLDGDAIAELSSVDLTITNEYTEPKSGRNSTFARFKPLLLDKMLELKAEFFKDAAALMLDTITEAPNSDFTSILTDGTNTITVTNCYVESDNFGEFDGDKTSEVKYSLTIKNANSVFS